LNKSILIVLRILFGTSSRIAPKITGKIAYRLFGTTLKPASKSAKIQAFISNAQCRFDTAAKHTIAYSGGSVAAFEFMPANEAAIDEIKTVWLVHGWQSNSLYMYHFVDPLLDRGFRVVSVDLPGHGQSSGRTCHLPLAVAALNAAIDALGHFELIVSHSLGGPVVATTLAGTLPDLPDHTADKLVLISSPDSMYKLYCEFASMISLAGKSTDMLHAIVARETGKTIHDFSTGIQLQNRSTELLLLHSPDDKEIAFSEAQAISQHNPAATLEPVPGLGHRRIIADNNVVQTAVNFIAS